MPPNASPAEVRATGMFTPFGYAPALKDFR